MPNICWSCELCFFPSLSVLWPLECLQGTLLHHENEASNLFLRPAPTNWYPVSRTLVVSETSSNAHSFGQFHGLKNYVYFFYPYRLIFMSYLRWLWQVQELEVWSLGPHSPHGSDLTYHHFIPDLGPFPHTAPQHLLLSPILDSEASPAFASN